MISTIRRALANQRIDQRLAWEMRPAAVSRLDVFSRSFPVYRFVDLYRAAERCCAEAGDVVVVESQNHEGLKDLLGTRVNAYAAMTWRIVRPAMVGREMGYKREEFFPADRFWVVRPSREVGNGRALRNDESGDGRGLRGAESRGAGIVRVRVEEYSEQEWVEVASADKGWGEGLLERIVRRSVAESIYRGRLLQVGFEPQVRDDDGTISADGPIQLTFKHEDVGEEDVILEEEVRGLLVRNVFGFHARRDVLRKHGVPSRKGILFYGPPGTGKTYTCRYIYSRLKGVTTLVVNGQSLLQVKAICSLARLYQPSLLVLEDVDLIFTSREINLYSTALGDLMDELDGFQSDEPVTFLLTTNAIERVEQEIKDQPGWISQCIYFGPSGDELRRLNLERYLRPYDASGLDTGRLVRMTDGSSQAFIKELIYRAVQIGLEEDGRDGERLRLKDTDFEAAVEEMTRFSEKGVRAILGFRADR